MGPDYEEEKPGFIKRIVQIPCLRQSGLYGISSGLASGLAYFLFTSNSLRASQIGYIAMCSVGMVTWIPCRYKRLKGLWEEAERQQEENTKIKLIDPKDI